MKMRLRMARTSLEAERPTIKGLDARIKGNEEHEIKRNGQEIDEMKQKNQDVAHSTRVENRQGGHIETGSFCPVGKIPKDFSKNMPENHGAQSFCYSERNNSTFIEKLQAGDSCAFVAYG